MDGHPARRFFANVQCGDPAACWPWRGTGTRGGYGTSTHHLTKRSTTAPRLAYEFAFGAIPEGLYVLHSCDNPSCCNPAHLRAGTQQENMADMHGRGRYGFPKVVGEAHPMAKLTNERARRIRALGILGISQTLIADLFRVGQSTISRVLRGEDWTHA